MKAEIFKLLWQTAQGITNNNLDESKFIIDKCRHCAWFRNECLLPNPCEEARKAGKRVIG